MVILIRQPPPIRRCSDAANETGTLSGGDLGLLGITPQSASSFYDNAGNMIVNPQNPLVTYTYDAWNRLIAPQLNGNAEAFYGYDGLNRRITHMAAGIVTHDYFNDHWQVLEQRKGSSTAASAQFVWSAGYVDALVQEKRDTDANGGPVRTLSATHDANLNITAAVQTDGKAAERYLYDPYGVRSLLTANWQPSAGGAWDHDTGIARLAHGHQGGRYDTSWGSPILFRGRYLEAYLQRWLTRDPLADAYQDGPNLYQYVGSNPVNWVDPSGRMLQAAGSGDPKYDSNLGWRAGQTFGRKLGEAVGVVLRAVREEARRRTLELYPKGSPGSESVNTDGEADAFKHCYFACLLAAIFGGGENGFGKFVTDQKEESDNRIDPRTGAPRQGPLQSAMDYHNNWVGMEIGQQIDPGGVFPVLPGKAFQNDEQVIESVIRVWHARFERAKDECVKGCRTACRVGTVVTLPPPGPSGQQ